MMRRFRGNVLERFFNKVEVTSNCWNWKGSKTTGGYGNFYFCGKKVYSHRFCYEIHFGFIPKQLTIDHLCRNRACCNPYHLEAVTNKENILRGMTPCARNAKKTCCPKCGGTYTSKQENKRYCRSCYSQYTRIYRHEYRIQNKEKFDMYNARKRERRRLKHATNF